jgi:hypothetical protein
MAKRKMTTKGQTKMYKILHRKLQITPMGISQLAALTTDHESDETYQ